jgi:threonine dehydrogenase-like Zn-dependent dehydrogenase
MTVPAVVLTAEGLIALRDRPRPTLRPDQVLVEVDLRGICGSDLHPSQLPQVYRGDCILGHESPGRVAAAGEDVADWAAGQRVAVNPNGNVVDVVLECSGSAAATATALKLLAPGGILVVVGAGAEPGLDSATILLKEITVWGSYIYADEFDRAIQLLATRQIAVADLTTVISPLADALTAFDALRAGEIMKALIAS